ncbi:serine/threonine kinase, partial [Aphelenchoides avenae]
SFGSVTQAVLHREYAVKTAPFQSVELLTRLLREADVTRRHRHSNIVPTRLCYIDEHNVYLVQQFMEKGDLEGILTKQRQRRFSEPVAAHVVCEVLQGLKYIHKEAALVHRDLKLDNILVSALGEVKIGDFGLCGDLREE